MSLSRRLFISSLIGLAAFGRVAVAQEKSPLAELLSDVSDQSLRDFIEKHDSDGKWDGKHYYDRQNNQRYTREEWRKELQWRYQEEKEGRDWRKERYGKDFKDHPTRDDDKNSKRKDKDNKDKNKNKKSDKKKPPRPPKDKRPDPKKG